MLLPCVLVLLCTLRPCLQLSGDDASGSTTHHTWVACKPLPHRRVAMLQCGSLHDPRRLNLRGGAGSEVVGGRTGAGGDSSGIKSVLKKSEAVAAAATPEPESVDLSAASGTAPASASGASRRRKRRREEQRKRPAAATIVTEAPSVSHQPTAHTSTANTLTSPSPNSPTSAGRDCDAGEGEVVQAEAEEETAAERDKRDISDSLQGAATAEASLRIAQEGRVDLSEDAQGGQDQDHRERQSAVEGEADGEESEEGHKRRSEEASSNPYKTGLHGVESRGLKRRGRPRKVRTAEEEEMERQKAERRARQRAQLELLPPVAF